MDDLNYRQLSAKFPLCNNGLSSNDAWAYLLKRWRDEGKLQERKHWKYGPSVDGNNQPTKYYDVAKVIRLVVVEHNKGNARPRIAFLCQNYIEEFLSILKPVTVDSSDNGQAILP